MRTCGLKESPQLTLQIEPRQWDDVITGAAGFGARAETGTIGVPNGRGHWRTGDSYVPKFCSARWGTNTALNGISIAGQPYPVHQL